ncbi:hypothetical protein [Krasilnikoviella flava]|uniref:Uncharacterized protein n=1 Tax=Krasilnikoviella flava TaxID=526729 RepID=A0A1T5M2F5_9MICO|nr:hypothetical protein [Krasilnikoviella flava]SKC82410.1 hypothetical protein SAMN04324258_4349 [Krasilnikoviella flava]
MTEEHATPGATTGPVTVPGPRAGDAPVTAMSAATSGDLDGLEGLDDLPVGEHVERFTQVHDALRARLDGAPEGAHGDGPDAGPGR